MQQQMDKPSKLSCHPIMLFLCMHDWLEQKTVFATAPYYLAYCGSEMYRKSTYVASVVGCSRTSRLRRLVALTMKCLNTHLVPSMTELVTHNRLKSLIPNSLANHLNSWCKNALNGAVSDLWCNGALAHLIHLIVPLPLPHAVVVLQVSGWKTSP